MAARIGKTVVKANPKELQEKNHEERCCSRRAWVCRALGVTGVSLYSSAHAEPPAAASPQQAEAQDHQQWLLAAMTKVETVRPGMTRADVTPLFVSAPSPTAYGSRQPFALRDCPLIKVNISFLPA